MKIGVPDELTNAVPGRDDWYRIVNAANGGDTAEIWIYNEIGFFGVTADDFLRELAEIDAAEILLHVASRGGDIFDGVAIFNALRTHSATVTAQVDSMAASIASVIVQAGDTRIMITGSQMMIHEASMFVYGGAQDMRDSAGILDKQSDIIAGIYAERSGGTESHFRDLMAAETWMTATETVAEDLADEVTNPQATDTDGSDNQQLSAITGLTVWDDFISSTDIEMETI